MVKVHDMGGRPNDDPIDQGEHVLMDWERRIDSIRGILGDKGYLVVTNCAGPSRICPRALPGLGLLRALDRGRRGHTHRKGRPHCRRA